MSSPPLPSVIPETQSQQLTLDSLDAEIQSAREQISALTSRRKTLTNHLLSSSTASTTSLLPSPVPASTPAKDSDLSHLRLLAHNNSQTSLHRTLIPTTTFAAHDPAPNAPDGGKVLGIRFENFSTRERGFGVPYYLLLHRPWKGRGRGGEGKERVRREVRVHRHTLPEWVGVGEVVGRYLPEPSEVGGDDEDGEGSGGGEESEEGEEGEGSGDEGLAGRKKAGDRQDLQGLVLELRRRLAGRQRREDAFEVLGDSNGVKSVVHENVERTEATFFLRDGRKVGVKVDEEGVIVDVRCLDERGKRRFDVEREWKGRERIELVEL